MLLRCSRMYTQVADEFVLPEQMQPFQVSDCHAPTPASASLSTAHRTVFMYCSYDITQTLANTRKLS